jgi:hypothetical protein
MNCSFITFWIFVHTPIMTSSKKIHSWIVLFCIFCKKNTESAIQGLKITQKCIFYLVLGSHALSKNALTLCSFWNTTPYCTRFSPQTLSTGQRWRRSPRTLCESESTHPNTRFCSAPPLSRLEIDGFRPCFFIQWRVLQPKAIYCFAGDEARRAKRQKILCG